MKNFVDHLGNSVEIELAVDNSTPGLMTQQDKIKLDGIAEGANKYELPLTLPATIIAEDSSNRFVTDAQISTWNAKASTAVATTSANGLMSSTDKSKLNGIATGANAYSHPTTSGNKHIPSGGSSGQILRWSSDGTATWGADNNTTYSAATTSANGLMSAADKTKLNALGLACCAKSTTGTTVSLPALEITKVNLSTFSVRTDTSVFEISNGGVKVNRAGTIMVSGSVYINLTSTQVATGCYVYKGSSEIASQYILQFSSGAICSGTRIITVAAGDIIYLHTRAGSATTYNTNVETTNLCITYLK